MPTPAFKRRRIDVANATLRKPFKSPVIRPGSSQSKASSASRTPSPLKSSFQAPGTAVSVDSGKGSGSVSIDAGAGANETLPRDGEAVGKNGVSTSPWRVHKLPHSANFETESLGDGDAPTFVWRERRDELEAKNLELEREIARRRTESTAHAESHVSAREKDSELGDLAEKWKAAARQAAEELFEISKARVQNMGGMKEMKAMRKRQSEFFNQFDESPTRRKSSQESDTKYYDSGSPPPEESPPRESQEEDKQLTMGAMLRSLNIEFEEIGYDEVEDRWKD